MCAWSAFAFKSSLLSECSEKQLQQLFLLAFWKRGNKSNANSSKLTEACFFAVRCDAVCKAFHRCPAAWPDDNASVDASQSANLSPYVCNTYNCRAMSTSLCTSYVKRWRPPIFLPVFETFRGHGKQD